MRPRTIIRTCILLQLLGILTLPALAAADADARAEKILSATGIKGGLVVHLNCGAGTLTAALRESNAYLVHGLARTPEALDRARATIRARGHYGPVSVDLLAGEVLPYIDNSVNLVVAHAPVEVPKDEILRVLAPLGVAYVQESGQWTQYSKPWPANIDEWTHYMHDPSNNAVAHDTAIGPLRHLQWDSSPAYSRHHEFTSSVAAVVSARGRLFSIMDMGSRASIHLPPKWRLTARDAFNGIVLWERPIKSWFNHLWPLKDGPAQPPRRLVAVGDSVYVTLDLEAPVSRLDAATGRSLHTYKGTEFTEEILCSENTLILLKNSKSMNPQTYYPKLMICWDEKNRTMKKDEGYLLKSEKREILALNAATGERLWQAEYPVEPLTLTADDQRVYFHNWERLICLDRLTGQEQWRSAPAAPRESMGYVYGPTLVAYGDVVLFADGRQKRQIYAFSKQTGTLLWQAPHYPAGHAGSPEDLMVVDGLVWCGKIAGGKQSGVFTGRDPNTGKVIREFEPNVDTYWFHHRCYRAKATDKYILTSRTGIEFVDINQENWETHHWVRGACSYGIVPCNGLIYAPPHPCACYLDSKLSGLCALAPKRSVKSEEGRVKETENRLVKGPAYGTFQSSPFTLHSSTDWPTYRHDMARSGTTTASVSAPLSQAWRVNLKGKLTSPVIAGGRLYTAAPERHMLYSLDADSGRIAWTFAAGAKVDSPPTVYRGQVIFGSADGHVYCLRATDGTLVWRFRAAPQDQRLVSYGRLESVWPVHGSVLVRDGVVHCVAGRSTYLDGGLSFIRLDAISGKLLSERKLHDQQNPQNDVETLNMPAALPDILSSSGDMIYMRSQAFDLKGRRVQTVDPTLKPLDRATDQLGRGTHLFSPTGFLDDNAWHRSYWVYGRAFSSGCNWWYRSGRYAPGARMLVFDEDRVYGFGREPGLFVWSHVLENRLFCSAAQADEASIQRVKQWSNKAGRDAIFNRSVTRLAAPQDRFAPQVHWSVTHPPLHARAMLLTRNTLFVAGPPDVLNEDEAFERPFADAVQAKIREQEAAYEGQRGGVLLGVSPDQGSSRFQIDLPAPPVWDGMAAVAGKLFICTKDGYVTCLAGR